MSIWIGTPNVRIYIRFKSPFRMRIKAIKEFRKIENIFGADFFSGINERLCNYSIPFLINTFSPLSRSASGLMRKKAKIEIHWWGGVRWYCRATFTSGAFGLNQKLHSLLYCFRFILTFTFQTSDLTGARSPLLIFQLFPK